MELVRMLFFALFATMMVAAVGVVADLKLIKTGKKAWLHPKWVWNLLELGVIFGWIVLKFNWVLPWWHFAFLMGTMAFYWTAFHDCWMGIGLSQGPWYLGVSKWDRKMSGIFNQFGMKPGLVFFLFKLFWAGILTGGFLSL